MIDQLILATSNIGKRNEFAAALKGVIEAVEVLPKGFQMPDETGSTFLENALLKAHFVAEATGKICLADDSGLVVPSLRGEPGVYSARYAGINATDEENRQKLLAALRDKRDLERVAYFTSALAVVWPDGREVTSVGRCDGIIALQPSGTGGFGYDSIFYVPDQDQTFAQMPLEEKNKISHRAMALRLLLDILSSLA